MTVCPYELCVFRCPFMPFTFESPGETPGAGTVLGAFILIYPRTGNWTDVVCFVYRYRRGVCEFGAGGERAAPRGEFILYSLYGQLE